MSELDYLIAKALPRRLADLAANGRPTAVQRGAHQPWRRPVIPSDVEIRRPRQWQKYDFGARDDPKAAYLAARLNAHHSGKAAAKLKAIDNSGQRFAAAAEEGYLPRPDSVIRGGRNSRNVSRKHLRALER